MGFFDSEKKEETRTLEQTQDDLKKVIKIINLFESILIDAAPEILLKPKFLALKNITRKLNTIYLGQKEEN